MYLGHSPALARHGPKGLQTRLSLTPYVKPSVRVASWSGLGTGDDRAAGPFVLPGARRTHRLTSCKPDEGMAFL